MGVRRGKAAFFQWVQVPPGHRSSRDFWGHVILLAAFTGGFRLEVHHSVTKKDTKDVPVVLGLDRSTNLDDEERLHRHRSPNRAASIASAAATEKSSGSKAPPIHSSCSAWSGWLGSARMASRSR